MTAGKPPVQSLNRFLRKTRRQGALLQPALGREDRMTGITDHQSLFTDH